MDVIDKKLPYEEPEISLVDIVSEDILATSDGNDIDEDLGLNDGVWL